MTQHNPILGREEFPKFNLFARRPVIDPGIAIVLFKDNGEMFTVMQGERLTAGDIAWGRYRGFYKVDIALHSFRFQDDLPCDQDAFNFKAEVQVTYQVKDPQEIVKNQITDIRSVIEPEIVQKMRRISRKYRAEQSQDAEYEINDLFRSGLYIQGISVNRIIANLELEAASRNHLRTIQNIRNQKIQESIAHDLEIMRSRNEFEIKKLKMEFYEPLIREGQWNLLALHLAQRPEDVATIVNMITQQQQIDLENQLKMLKVMLESDVIEGFHIEEVGKRVLRQLVSSIGQLEARSLNRSNRQSQLPENSSDQDDSE
ncbi:SPFH domain-containing protein [Chloroflexus aurantiacus]